MTDKNDEESPRPKGLPLLSLAPEIDTVDIYDSSVKLSELLTIYEGVMIDFFRGNW